MKIKNARASRIKQMPARKLTRGGSLDIHGGNFLDYLKNTVSDLLPIAGIMNPLLGTLAYGRN